MHFLFLSYEINVNFSKRNLILRNQQDLSHKISSFVDLFSIRILVENININKLGRESVRKLDISSVLHQNSFSGYSFHRGQTLPQEGQLNVLKYNFFMAHQQILKLKIFLYFISLKFQQSFIGINYRERLMLSLYTEFHSIKKE